jgi:hypothetical protein
MAQGGGSECEASLARASKPSLPARAEELDGLRQRSSRLRHHTPFHGWTDQSAPPPTEAETAAASREGVSDSSSSRISGLSTYGKETA